MSEAQSHFKLPRRGEWRAALRSLSTRAWRWFIAFLLLGLVAVLWLVGNINRYWSVEVSAPGGSLSEGIIGSPRFINPLLAVSDADRDLTALIYSGLMRVSESGQPEPDLAEQVEISPDGLAYTFRLRPKLHWHDGSPLTSEDVAFTIANAQDPALKSPKRANWEGVSVETPDPLTIVLHLKQPYPAFLETTTLGILPKHIWGRLDHEAFALNQFNTESVGSGPYRIDAVKKDSLGIPEYYDLVPFAEFALGEPKISHLRLRFYPNETELVNAYTRGEIESAATLSAENAQVLEAGGAHIIRDTLPRVFGVFFNQNKATVLANAEVRQALNLTIDRRQIIDTALKGYGSPTDSPLPAVHSSSTTALSPDVTGAEKILTAKGWTRNAETQKWEKRSKTATTPLTLTLTTSDTPELKHAAELIRDSWNRFGAQVDLKVFEIGDLNQNIIRPRQYDALFFGLILGRNPDPFAFWHSSQRLDPGLNVALYTNSVADKALESARRERDPATAQDLYAKFVAEVQKDVPAVLVYAPDFIYLLPEGVHNVNLPPINTASDRFLNIHRWFIETDRVWPIFANQNNQIN